MKKLAALLIFLMISITPVMAFEPEYMDVKNYEGPAAIDALVFTGSGYFYGIVCQTDGTNSVTFAVDDSIDGTGTPLHADIICTTSATARTCVYGFDPPIPFSTGLYVNLTSTDATPDYSVFYRGK